MSNKDIEASDHYDSWYNANFDKLKQQFISDNPEDFGNNDEAYDDIERNQLFQDFCEDEYSKVTIIVDEFSYCKGVDFKTVATPKAVKDKGKFRKSWD